jgi:hypothetical protein
MWQREQKPSDCGLAINSRRENVDKNFLSLFIHNLKHIPMHTLLLLGGEGGSAVFSILQVTIWYRLNSYPFSIPQ